MAESNQYINPLEAVAESPEQLIAGLPVSTAIPDDFSEELQTFFMDLDWKNVDTAAYIFDPTEEDISVSYTLEWHGVPFAPLGGICGMNGRPGNGKTMSFSTMIAAMLRGEYMGLRCPMEGKQRVLYADTEMEKVNHQRTVRRIYEMVGWNKGEDHRDQLDTLTLRKAVSAKDRLKIIIKRIWEYRPTAVFIDGIIDLVEDFNDNKECQLRIYQLMALAEKLNIVVWSLLHLNPGSEKSVGHLGSFLERKATDILLTSQDKETQGIVITHEKHRFIKIMDINYQVRDDENHYGIPFITDVDGDIEALPAAPSKKVKEEVQYPADPLTFFAELIPTNGIGSRAMRERLNEKIGIGHDKADNYCNEMVKRGILTKQDGRYFLNNNSMGDDPQAQF